MSLEDGIEYVKIYSELEVEHGVDGWYLDDMEWRGDGLALFQYERSVPGVGLELAIVTRKQPTLPRHPGWANRKPPSTVTLTEKDWVRWERGIDLNPPELVDYD
jgi:hypothetical protein